MLEHGGRLRAAAQRYGIPLSDWLDLSTGIAPYHPPLPSISSCAWTRLPEPEDGLEVAARQYYGARAVLPVAGSQSAIQALPRLRGSARIGIVSPCYAEHAEAWRRAGHRVVELCEASVPRALDQLDVLVVVNPNNPTGATVPRERLLDWAAQLSARGGWLIVDEAFGDTGLQASAASPAAPAAQGPVGMPEGLIVLRSVGKFFGLAGLRLGFVAAQPALLDALADLLGPWTVSGPAQQVALAALRDTAWQERTRARLRAGGQRLQSLLAAHGIHSSGSALFQWWPEARAEAFHEHMARHGIWVRLFTNAARGIRLGLPPDEAGWQRLEHALTLWTKDKQ